MAEVQVDKNTGEVQVVRVVCAQDMGLVINPQGATLQVEGCITMGLGYALSEDIQFTGGKIHNNNFNDYEIPKFSWIPEIECERPLIPETSGRDIQPVSHDLAKRCLTVSANGAFIAGVSWIAFLPWKRHTHPD